MMKIALLILLTIVVLFMWSDFIYSCVIASHVRKWEASIRWDDDGVRTGCRAFSTGEGDVGLLLVHGINDTPKIWHKMAPVLAGHGLHCRAMRLPGFAQRTSEYAEATIPQWMAAIETELADLRAAHAKVCIVAHSLGGAIVINYLLEHPEAAEKVVLIAPAVGVSDERSPLLTARAWNTVSGRLMLFTSVTESPYPNDTSDPVEQDYPWRTSFCPRSITNHTFELLDRIAADGSAFRTPMMMVLSKKDKVVDWKASKDFYDEAASTEKQIEYMKDTGHAIPVDYGWEELSEKIAEFCRE
ncbi:MAG: hypothetical protein CMJ18_02550 [Phycisphaeraceae bacterium]|nr:hypothetical protein [Phycisphaeraceae bacterium]